ncbi:hypothetical protein IL992_02255 [Microbispora sp. NEAU-D428]|nr:hypothetical protein [Microbispora sitophila]
MLCSTRTAEPSPLKPLNVPNAGTVPVSLAPETSKIRARLLPSFTL